MANAGVIVVFFVVITSFMVLLYKYNCTKVIYGWLIMSSAIILYFMGWI
eukprot:gene11027-10542_t